MRPSKADQIKQAIKERNMREPWTKEAALARLVAEGICTPDGKLTPRYSTDPQPIAEFLAQP